MSSPDHKPNGTISTLKRDKETFVSHHSGTNLSELCALIALVPLLTFTLQWCSVKLQQHSAHTAGWRQALVQITWVVLPTVTAVMSESFLRPLLWGLCAWSTTLACWTFHRGHPSGLTKSLQQLAEQHRKRLAQAQAHKQGASSAFTRSALTKPYSMRCVL